MILVIVILAFILMIVCADFDEGIMLFGLIFVIGIIAIIFLTSNIVGQRTIDLKIEMYQEENTSIETKVKETVRAYMNFEENTYKELVEEADLTTLLVKYPDLNSNELVKTEVNLYIENNNKIKQLKEKKINITIYKWWLYFGK